MWQEELKKKGWNIDNGGEFGYIPLAVIRVSTAEQFITSLLKKQSKQEQINAMLDVLEDISKFPYSPSQLVPWNHILVEINKKITEIKALNAPEP